jgi:hypothetical protein
MVEQAEQLLHLARLRLRLRQCGAIELHRLGIGHTIPKTKPRDRAPENA